MSSLPTSRQYYSEGYSLFLVSDCVVRTTTCNDRPSFEGVQCIDTPSGFQCGDCPPGFTGDGQQCIDINEVSSNQVFLYNFDFSLKVLK